MVRIEEKIVKSYVKNSFIKMVIFEQRGKEFLIISGGSSSQEK